MKNIYGVIIGTEILNGRRNDKHFAFLQHALKKRGWTLHANFIIKDHEKLMSKTFKLIKQDKNSYLFSFGGIGATPDDLTREIAAKVFTCKDLKPHKKALELIVNQFGDEAYPHRVKMANLPENAKLLTNVVNQVPGFSLEDRFFFMPGFPSMSHPMVEEALEKYIGYDESKSFKCNFLVNTGESDIIDIMNDLPNEVELSSLPHINEDGSRTVEIYMSSKDKNSLKE